MSSTANRVVKNTGFLYAKMGITMFISLYTTRLILNSLGAADFGIFNIVGGAIAMLGFLNAAMAGATQRFMSYSEGEGNKKKQKSIFNISILLHFFIALAAGIALLIAGYFFFNGILNIPADRIFAAKVVYGSLIVSTMFTVMSVPYDAVLNAHENMKYYAIVGIIESLLKLSVALIVVYTFSDKLIVYGVLMACIPLITLTIMRIYCHKHYTECTIAPKKYWDKTMMKEMTSFAGWSFGNSATSMIGNYGLGIVLNMFFGTVLNAAQGIAGQISGQLSVFASNMLKALNPVIGKSAGASNHDLSTKIALSGCKFTFLITAIFTLPVIIEAPYILSLWLKQVPEYTVIFTRLQLIKTLIEQLTLVLNTSISAQGNIKRISLIVTFLNILPLPLIYIAFHLGSPPYAMYLISIAIWSICEGGIRIYFAWKNCQIPPRSYFITTLIPCLIITTISLLTGGIITNIMPFGVLRLIITVSCCTGVLIGSFLYKGINVEEREKLTLLVKSLKNKIKHNI